MLRRANVLRDIRLRSIRSFGYAALIALMAVALTACQARDPGYYAAVTDSRAHGARGLSVGGGVLSGETLSGYGAMRDGEHVIPAVDLAQFDPRLLRQVVDEAFDEPPGTIIVDTQRRFLFLTLPDGRAMRYGIGVGRDGFAWSGRAVVGLKREWPVWTPPASMVAREPELAKHASGMEPGLDNPLGARALYLYQNGRDTLYRIHGTNEPWSIGLALSSGCIRMLNQDVIDLYDRVERGARVVVRHGGRQMARN